MGTLSPRFALRRPTFALLPPTGPEERILPPTGQTGQKQESQMAP